MNIKKIWSFGSEQNVGRLEVEMMAIEVAGGVDVGGHVPAVAEFVNRDNAVGEALGNAPPWFSKLVGITVVGILLRVDFILAGSEVLIVYRT
jgi:hypothetical protein